MSATIRLEGAQETIRAFNALTVKVQKKGARRALNLASTPIRQATRENIRAGQSDDATGALAESVITRSRTYARGETAINVTGPSAQKGPHGHLVEFGSGPRYQHTLISRTFAKTKSKRWLKAALEAHGVRGKFTGRMPARPFLRPAFDANVGKAQAIIVRVLTEEIERFAEGGR